MNNFKLCFWLVIFGVASQVQGIELSEWSKILTDDVLDRTNKLVNFGVERLLYIRSGSVLNEIDDRLNSIKNEESECHFNERRALNQLKKDYNANSCLNITDIFSDFATGYSDLFNLVLQRTKQAYSVVTTYAGCASKSTSNQLLCIQNAVGDTQKFLDDVITDYVNIASNIASTVLNGFVQATNCLLKPSSLQQGFAEISKSSCN